MDQVLVFFPSQLTAVESHTCLHCVPPVLYWGDDTIVQVLNLCQSALTSVVPGWCRRLVCLETSSVVVDTHARNSGKTVDNGSSSLSISSVIPVIR